MPASTSKPTSTTSVRRLQQEERGTGLLGSVVGVTVFLVLLLFATQLALNLYATSAVTSVAFDAAREVAGSDGGPASADRAERHARSVLDRFESGGGRLEFAWDVGREDVVALTVVAERPSLLSRVRFPFQRVRRTVTVRWERPR
jgi:hypothetical protein